MRNDLEIYYIQMEPTTGDFFVAYQYKRLSYVLRVSLVWWPSCTLKIFGPQNVKLQYQIVEFLNSKYSKLVEFWQCESMVTFWFAPTFPFTTYEV